MTVTNERLGGLNQTLPPVTIEKVINHKKHVHGKNV